MTRAQSRHSASHVPSRLRRGAFVLEPGTPEYDAEWLRRHLAMLPKEWEPRIYRRYTELFRKDGERLANTWIRTTTARIQTLPLPLAATDDDIRAFASEKAMKALDLQAKLQDRSMVGYWQALCAFVSSYGLDVPPVEDGTEDEIKGATARMTCPLWWRRGIRRLHARTIEDSAIRLGFVHARAEKYVSNANVRRRQSQKRRNAETLTRVEAVNQDGYAETLANLAEKSTANPAIRRGELLARARGFEEIARGLEHAALFVTVTCPSRMHAKRTVYRKGQPVRVLDNPSFDGSTPRDGQRHLGKAWAKNRAYLHRCGVRLYGFRIAEPHQDGAPHWHLLLFMAPSAVKPVRQAITRYFLDQHDPDEPGAAKNRVKFVPIKMDAAHSATGYILKYIAKNIDGYQVQEDLFGDCAIEGAARVDAWASTWGIRQFQQIGGAPVGVWRELRRMEAAAEHTPLIEAARIAADDGEWAAYVHCQGGPTVARKDLAITVAKTRPGERWCPIAKAPEPAPLTRYGETSPAGIYGVLDVTKSRAFESRRFKWEIRRVSSQNKARPARAAAPWTRVNNCTPRPSGACAGNPSSAPNGFADTWPAPSTCLSPFSDSPADPWPDWFSPMTATHPRISTMFDPNHPTTADVQTLRIELFVAEKRVKDLRDQLNQAGDSAFIAQHDRECNGSADIDFL